MGSMRLSSRKTVVLALFAIALVYILGSWLLLPRVLQSQSEKYIAEKTGHLLNMDRPEFNPFNLSLRLYKLRLAEPDGKRLLAFKELLVDFSATSMVRRAWVFDAIQLDGLDTGVVVLPGDKLNWSALLESLQDKTITPSAQPAEPLPRLEIASLSVTDGNIELADQRSSQGFSTRIQPLELHLEELSTLPVDKGHYQLSARTDFGARVQWRGDMELNPLAINGRFSVEDIALAKLAPLIKLPLRIAPLEGTAMLSANYRLSESRGQVDLVLDQIEAKLAGLKLRPDKNARGAAPLLALDSIALTGGYFDLRQRSVTVKTIALGGGEVNLLRNKDGRLNVLDLMPAPAAKTAAASVQAATPVAPASPSWRYRIGHVALSGMRANFRDQAVSPAAQLALHDIAIGIDNITDKLDTPWPLQASFNADSGGRFAATGTMVAASPAVDMQIKLAGLSLKPVQPYLGAATTLTLQSGAVSAAGRARYGPEGKGFNGNAAVNNLRLTEEGIKTDFMSWKSLTASKLDATPDALQIADLALVGLDTQLIIAKDKTVNLSRVVRPPPASAVAATTSAPSAAAEAGKTPPYRVDIDRLRIAASEMEFADYSLALPFGTHIHHLHGTINGLSSRPVAPGQLELDGQVDDYGTARAAGQVNLFDPTDYMDLKVVFRNIEMTRLTPYSATFAGRKIKSGKLSLDLDYKIKQRQLVGENKVVMDQLTLGERVESPQAKDLPLDLAIALLQDSDGRIDLGLPVSGSLDDPQFSFGGIVWKVIVNVLTKVATAPFRALGALFGGEQALDNIAFEAGRTQLAPPEREKLVKLATTLNKRPALALSLHGTYADIDRIALQDQQLRRKVADKAGYQVDTQHDPGPVSTGQPKVRAALESLYSDRMGRGALAALKDGFRKANPGQMEESGTGKLISRLGNVFGGKHDLSDSEMAGLKNADFYAVLYQRLRDKETVTDERLQALAQTRGDAALAELKAANAPAERVALLAPKKSEANGNEVRLGIEAAAAGK